MNTKRYINLSDQAVETLKNVYEGKTKAPHNLRTRCHGLLLSHRGKDIATIADILGCQKATVREWMNRFEAEGVDGLLIRSGRGRKPTLLQEDEAVNEFIKKKIAENPMKLAHTTNALLEAFGLIVTKRMLVRYLKKGKYTYRRIRKALKKVADPETFELKALQLAQLLKLEEVKHLKVYFADQAHFDETPNVPYGWQPKEKGFCMPAHRGKSTSVMGFMTRNNELITARTDKTITAAFVIEQIDAIANNPVRKEDAVIVLDNASIHRAKIFQQQIPVWEEQGVRIFYLPPYSPHLNFIEILWRKMKYEWLLPQHYESWETLLAQIDDIICGFGIDYKIDFSAA